MKRLSTSLSWLIALTLLLTAFFSVSPVSTAASPTIVLSQTSGQTGTSIIVTGQDFTPNYYYYIFFGQLQNFKLDQGTVGSDGTFSQSITINFTTPGNYQITVYASAVKPSNPSYNSNYDQGAVAFFSLLPTPVPAIMVNPSKGKEGFSITVNGQYFTKNYYYYIFFDGSYKAKGTVDSNGKFSQSITIPVVFNMGDYDITAMASKVEDTSPSIKKTYDETATTYFTVVYLLPTVTLDNNQGTVADTFTLSGGDFSAGDIITVYWDGVPIGSTFSPNTSNTFVEKFTVPETYAGSHIIKVASTTQQFSLNYTVIPDITLSSSSLKIGDQITINGTGFAAKSNITFYIDNTALTDNANSSTKGSFNGQSITLTNITAGSHLIKAQDNSGNSDSKPLDVSSPQPATTSTTLPPTPTASPAITTPAPTQTTVVAPSSTTPATTQITPAPTQTTLAPKTSTSAPSQTASSSFPVWATILIVILAVLVIIAIVMVIISRRKSFH